MNWLYNRSNILRRVVIPLDKKTCGMTNFQSTKSRGGEQFLLQDSRAKDAIDGVFFQDAGVTVTVPRILNLSVCPSWSSAGAAAC